MNVYILEDNYDEAISLKNIITKLRPSYKVILFTDVKLYLEAISQDEEIISYIDAFLGNQSGIDVSNHLNIKNKNIPIIFVSGKDKELYDVYEGTHIYFLEKPYLENKVLKSLIIAENKLDVKNYEFKFSKITYQIPLHSILFFESSARIIKIHSTNSLKLEYNKLDNVEKKLPNYFIRVSKSFIINSKYIKDIVNNEIILKDGFTTCDKIIISRKYKNGVLEKWNLFQLSNAL